MLQIEEYQTNDDTGHWYSYIDLVNQLKLPNDFINYLEKGKEYISHPNNSKNYLVNTKAFYQMIIDSSSEECSQFKTALTLSLFHKVKINSNYELPFEIPTTPDGWVNIIKNLQGNYDEQSLEIKNILCEIICNINKLTEQN
tara:strand:- start:1032 stop:1457 length:426 start_codon:yes stop_codon:yes gene_type:complete